MKRITFLILVSIHITIAYSQTGWFWQNPLPQGNSLRSVKFLDGMTGVAVGESGTILLSTNGGTNWSIINTNQKFRLNSVSVLDASTLIAVGDSGKILKTTNKGYNWFSIITSTGSDLNAVVFVNSQTGFIGGDSAILKSINGGDNWTIQTTIGIPVKDLRFVNENTGWFTRSYYYGYACPINDEILKTINGGIIWNPQFNHCHYGNNVFFRSIFFINSNTGWCQNYKTTDGGTLWFTQDSSGDGDQILFINENTGWKTSVYSKDIIFRSTNGGSNWLTSSSNSKTSLNSIFFVNPQSGWCAGKYGNSIKTTNGGLNWISDSDNFYNDINSLSFADSSNGFAGCKNGIIMKTSNSGTNWTSYFSGDTSNINQISFPSASTGFAVNGGRKILKTTNGGVNWFSVSTLSNSPRTLFFIDNLTGWVGSGATFYKTTNSGLNWSTLTFSGMVVINRIYFLNHQTGWATGWHILKTTDGGNSWIIKQAGTQNFFGSVFFISENTGWINKPSDREILRTTDGGNNWAIILPYNNSWLEDFYFIDSLKGLAVGSESRLNGTGEYFGLILETTNSGINWFSLPTISSEQDWMTICFTSSRKGWIAGQGGAILSTSNFNWEPIGINTTNSNVPQIFSLSQNYPNPFNPATKINFDIAASPLPSVGEGRGVRLIIYDALGREVATLVNQQLQPGTYEVQWDGTNYPSGVYFYKLNAGEYNETRKMVLVK